MWNYLSVYQKHNMYPDYCEKPSIVIWWESNHENDANMVNTKIGEPSNIQNLIKWLKCKTFYSLTF